MFVGNFTHNVDAKGRIFIPAKYRDELGQKFFASPSLDKLNCIRLYNNEEYAKVTDKLNTAGKKFSGKLRSFSHRSVPVDLDSQGRIMLPESLRGDCNITDKVIVAGSLSWVEIWEPSQYDEYMAKIELEQDDEISDEDWDAIGLK